MENILEFIRMPFFFRAFFVLFAIGLTYPLLGTFILNLELIPARFAVMHAALLGAAAGLLINFNPSVMAMAASVLAGVAIAVISYRGKVSAGGSLGLIMTVCVGLAFVIFYKSNVQAATAFNLFWGNVLTLTDTDVTLTLSIAGAIIIFLAAAYKEIHIVLYDRELAFAVGVRSKLVYGGIMLSICLGIALAMRVTGALLVDAVTILPALAARKTGKTFKGLIFFGALFGAAMNLSGFAISFFLDIPVSSAIIITGAVIMFVLKGVIKE